MRLLLVHGMGRTPLSLAVEETKIIPSDRPTVVPVGHTFMMNDRQVHAAIGRALAPSRRTACARLV
jgi:hypothetical protein